MNDEIEEDYYLKYPEQEKLPEGYHETKLTIDLMIENKSLREQLAKLQERDKQSVAKIIDLDGDILELKEQLAKERELRKEERDNALEQAIVFLGNQFPEYGNKEFSITGIRKLLESLKHRNIESLIKKAKE